MQWVHFLTGAEKGQTLQKDPAIARRLMTIGVCRLPTPAELAEAEATKAAEVEDEQDGQYEQDEAEVRYSAPKRKGGR